MSLFRRQAERQRSNVADLTPISPDVISQLPDLPSVEFLCVATIVVDLKSRRTETPTPKP